jgi:hypothetical protein
LGQCTTHQSGCWLHRKRTNRIKVPSREQIKTKLERREIDFDKIQSQIFDSKDFGTLLADYFAYRANILYSFVEPHLMDSKKARRTFEKFHKKLKPSRQVPMNKQSGEKKAPAYLTGLVNMLIEANSLGLPCDYDPRQLTLITKNGIKEYYYTTTFGSRVADGIYE